ncbi:segregation and condensation protein A [Bombiscardovia coagulans]|uniref:Segregation and condensation protein A n=1 Tax=Bombiscardovia coagulans TaxID=686666 RepID=A0A261EP35_9BIFI|nr:ScpA family protein [Bombiscardovia coagulans]OZG48621.1 chromosome segregation protein ScpA [Bombiscardovia coagulans]
MNATNAFYVDIDAYQGPFDVLLNMLANQRLELTEISLGSITDEFLEYVRGLDLAQNMDQASSFLDVAAVLVEAKSAALLPDYSHSSADDQTLEALRERDLLFARLLQYKAFKEAGSRFGAQIETNSAAHPHKGSVDAYAQVLLPQLEWTLSAEDLARMAAQVISNAPASKVAVAQLHVPLVDIRQQVELVRQRLIRADGQSISFTSIISDASSTLEVVARFLTVLILFRQGNLQYKQEGPFAPLYVRWASAGPDEEELLVSQGDVE